MKDMFCTYSQGFDLAELVIRRLLDNLIRHPDDEIRSSAKNLGTLLFNATSNLSLFRELCKKADALDAHRRPK